MVNTLLNYLITFPKRSPRISAIAAAAVLIMIAAATVAALRASSLAGQQPTWWREAPIAHSPEHEEATLNLAEQVERGLLTLVHNQQPADGAWTVEITEEQANAWLNAKLPKWLANRSIEWPDQLNELQVNFEPEQISVGARLTTNENEHIVAATVEASIDDAHAFWLRIAATQAGRLDLPRGWTIAALREWLPDSIRNKDSAVAALSALEGAAPLFPDAAFTLEDGRRIELLTITPEQDRLLLSLRTQRNP